MSLLDMAGSMLGGSGQGGNQAALSAILGMVSNHPGGLPGLISAFQQNGLGGVVSSWVSPGPNQPITGDQVQSVVGGNQIQDLSTKLGVPPAAASGVLAQLLPGIIDHLTPNGQVPAANSNLMEMGAGLLKNFIK